MEALLLCDDPDEAALLSTAIQRAGPSVSLFNDLERALHEWPDPELVVLALHRGVPVEHVRALRRHSEALLMTLIPSLDESLMCRILELGADWVQSRPYSTRLLIMQLRAMLRRGQGTRLVGLPILSEGDLVLDPSSRTVRIGDHPPRRLTQLEYRLLYTLLIHRGQIMPPATLIEHVWGYDGEGNMDLVRGLVRRLRAKIEENPRQPRYVRTIPGVGYLLNAEQDGETP